MNRGDRRAAKVVFRFIGDPRETHSDFTVICAGTASPLTSPLPQQQSPLHFPSVS